MGGSPASVTLTTGYSFASPNPRLPTFNLPTFNVVAAMREGVFQDDVPPSQKPKRSFPIVPAPAAGTTPTDDRPVLYDSSADVQADNLPAPRLQAADGSDDAAWMEVETAWAGADDYVGGVIAGAICAGFGWTTPVANLGPAAAKAGDPVTVGSTGSVPVVLNGVAPAQVVKNFEEFYVDVPFMCLADG